MTHKNMSSVRLCILVTSNMEQGTALHRNKQLFTAGSSTIGQWLNRMLDTLETRAEQNEKIELQCIKSNREVEERRLALEHE